MKDNNDNTPRTEEEQNHPDPQWELHLDESDERRFRHGATGYGVEIHRGNPEDRKSVFEEQFDDPTVFVDGRDVENQEDLVGAALLEMDADEEWIENQYSIGSIELKRALTETESNFVILEFDAMDREVQISVAQMMKGVAETIDLDDIMLGFACEEGGAVVRAERDLSMRIRSWELEPEDKDYDPLAHFEEGDMIETSARETPMKVTSVDTTPAANTELTAENHHGEYQFHSYNDWTISMESGSNMTSNVEVNLAE